MSMFSWFSRKPAPAKPRFVADPSSLLNADATVPLVPGRHGRPMPPQAPVEHAANRKNERMERRELLYTVVRDSMVRAGVLSASYKFKVLSLDQRGRQFLVMMDLAREYGGETVRLSEIEALIAQTAKTRHDILVTAVYWRINDHVAVGIPQRVVHAPAGHPAASPSPVRPPSGLPLAAGSSSPSAVPAGAGLAAPASGVRPAAPAGSAAGAAGAARPVPPARPTALPAATSPTPADRYEPIEADEVAAFKRALASVATTAGAGAALSAADRPGVPVHSGPILAPSALTGFEDTEMPQAEGPSPDLSSTQYGELH